MPHVGFTPKQFHDLDDLLGQFDHRIKELEQGGGGGGYTLPTMSADTKGGARLGEGLKVENDVLSAKEELGISGASAGQVAANASDDANGKPTSWQAIDSMQRTLTITCVTTDPGTVTGQTVTVRDTDSSGPIVAQLEYNGSPVSVQLPVGFHYHASVTDNMRFHGAPSTATGTIGSSAASATLTYASLNSMLERDTQTGHYTNASLADWWARQADGEEYGYAQPKGSTVTETKLGANASIANPTPGWVGHPAIDPYIANKCGPFIHYDVNGGANADGTNYVDAIRDIDSSFKLDGTNGEVLSMTAALYEKYDESGENETIKYVSDTPHDGYKHQPFAKLPDGTYRPYMLYPKYIGVKGADNKMHSWSGYKPWNRSVSHNSLITQCDTATTGKSGKSVGDDWYMKEMHNLKYATKNSQSVFAGCTGYSYQYSPAVAETGVTRVILTNAQAANLVVGSAMMLGTHTGTSNDRGTNYNYDVFDGVKILSITDYDENNKAVNMDTETTFDTDTTYLFSTSPWFSGSLDDVEGDGAISQAGLTNGKEPYVIQGIECAMGLTEILGNVIISNDGTSGWVPYVNFDSKNEATSLTSDYESTGVALPTTSSDGWKYPTHAIERNGLIYGKDNDATSSTGLCDGHYTNKMETTGTREWRSVGNLASGSNAGAYYVHANSVLTNTYWNIGSRVSVIGRSGGESDAEEEENG